MPSQITKHSKKPKRKRGEYSVYRPMGIIRAWGFTTLVLAPFVVIAPIWVIGKLHWGVALIYAVPASYSCGALMHLAYYFVFGNRLIICSEGIEFHIIGQRGFTCWHNLRRFGDMCIDSSPSWGIIFDYTVSISTERLARLFAPRSDMPDTCDKFIPLTYLTLPKRQWILFGDIDFDHFKTTPLGQDLLYYAPHLFEGVKAKGKRS